MKKTCGNCLHGKRIAKSKIIVCSMDEILQTKWHEDSACEKWKELKKKLLSLKRQ